jgi:hypothetical protein
MSDLEGERRSLLAAVILGLALSSSLVADETVAPVSYNLKVSIEPGPGDIAVQGKVEFENPGSQNFKFNLHETFAIKTLLVNGKVVSFSFATAEFSPMTPAAKLVVVCLPPDVPPGKMRMDIEYAGRLKTLPEFGAAPDQTPSMDDQVNSHLVELAGFSSWYPQFAFGGVPVAARSAAGRVPAAREVRARFA